MASPTRDDYDSPWKEALERYFPEFIALLYPKIHAEIDWTHAPELLDKELEQVVRDAELGRRYADKLAKVYTRDGAETWVLIHVEVQGEPDARPSFRRATYQQSRWGCEFTFRFPVQKLLDWRARWGELEASPNPFALVVMAHLKAQECQDGPTRKGWKLRLVRLL